VDVLFEGTEAGIAAQEAQLRIIAGSILVLETAPTIWAASQELWNSADSAASAIAKITTLPASIARTVETVHRAASSRNTHWKLTMQAPGIGWLRLESAPENLHALLSDLRFELEASGGSLVAFHQPAGMAPLDAWGKAGDAQPLMRAVKNQFDPRNTLNPGRFVGGI
jgi:glycolate oxidase FAD binding subunit